MNDINPPILATTSIEYLMINMYNEISGKILLYLLILVGYPKLSVQKPFCLLVLFTKPNICDKGFVIIVVVHRDKGFVIIVVVVHFDQSLQDVTNLNFSNHWLYV